MDRDNRRVSAALIMSPGERVMLLDAAMRSHDAKAFLDGVQSAFDLFGRQNDAVTVSTLRCLLQAGEIEVVMSMRAEWLGLRTLLQSRSDLGL